MTRKANQGAWSAIIGNFSPPDRRAASRAGRNLLIRLVWGKDLTDHLSKGLVVALGVCGIPDSLRAYRIFVGRALVASLATAFVVAVLAGVVQSRKKWARRDDRKASKPAMAAEASHVATTTASP